MKDNKYNIQVSQDEKDDTKLNVSYSVVLPEIRDELLIENNLINDAMASISKSIQQKQFTIIKQRLMMLGIDMDEGFKAGTLELECSYGGGSSAYFYDKIRIVTFFPAFPTESDPLKPSVGFTMSYY